MSSSRGGPNGPSNPIRKQSTVKSTNEPSRPDKGRSTVKSPIEPPRLDMDQPAVDIACVPDNPPSRRNLILTATTESWARQEAEKQL